MNSWSGGPADDRRFNIGFVKSFVSKWNKVCFIWISFWRRRITQILANSCTQGWKCDPRMRNEIVPLQTFDLFFGSLFSRFRFVFSQFSSFLFFLLFSQYCIWKKETFGPVFGVLSVRKQQQQKWKWEEIYQLRMRNAMPCGFGQKCECECENIFALLSLWATIRTTLSLDVTGRWKYTSFFFVQKKTVTNVIPLFQFYFIFSGIVLFEEIIYGLQSRTSSTFQSAVLE